jgi:hypothetical protein
MAITTLNDVIDRLKREGDLTRNSGAHSLKSVKDILSTQAAIQTNILEKFELYFDRMEADRLQAKSKGLQPTKSKVSTEFEKVTKEQNEKKSGLLSKVGTGVLAGGGLLGAIALLKNLPDRISKSVKSSLKALNPFSSDDTDPKGTDSKKMKWIKAIGKRFAPVAALLGLLGVADAYNTKLETAIADGDKSYNKTRLLIDAFGITANKTLFGTLEEATELLIKALRVPFSEELNNGKTNAINESLKKLEKSGVDFSKAAEATRIGFDRWSDGIVRDIESITSFTKKIGKKITDAIPDRDTEEIVPGVPNDQKYVPPVSNIDINKPEQLSAVQKRQLNSIDIPYRELANMDDIQLAKKSREINGITYDPNSWLGVSVINRSEMLDLLKIKRLQAKKQMETEKKYFTEDGVPIVQPKVVVPDEGPLIISGQVKRPSIPKAQLATDMLNNERQEQQRLASGSNTTVNTVVDNSSNSVNTDNSTTSVTQANSGLSAGQQIMNEALNF